MDDRLITLLNASLSEFFKSYGFNLQEHFAVDSDNKTIAIYCSPLCKLFFYRSVRDGEINCLVGKKIADNRNIDDGNWFYLNSILVNKSEFSIDQLLSNVPDVPLSDESQLSIIANQLMINFSAIVEKITNNDSVDKS